VAATLRLRYQSLPEERCPGAVRTGPDVNHQRGQNDQLKEPVSALAVLFLLDKTGQRIDGREHLEIEIFVFEFDRKLAFEFGN